MTRVLARTKDPAKAQRLVSDFQAAGQDVEIRTQRPAPHREPIFERRVPRTAVVYVLVAKGKPYNPE